MATVKLIGHHGTLIEYVDDIKTNGFKARYNDKHWLGQGIYFFEYNYGEAYGWAGLQLKQHSQGIAVIEAEIVVEEEKFADFNSRDTILSFNKFIDEFVRERCVDDAEKCIVLGKNRKANTCLLYDSYAEYNGISVMRKSFDGKIAALQKLQQICICELDYKPTQICVKDNKYIKIQQISCDRKKKYKYRHKSKELSSCEKNYSI